LRKRRQLRNLEDWRPDMDSKKKTEPERPQPKEEVKPVASFPLSLTDDRRVIEYVAMLSESILSKNAKQ
jgi:hypothetical protein